MAARDAAPFKKRLSEAIFGLASRGEPSVLFVVPGHWRGLQRAVECSTAALEANFMCGF